jgi:hypothetical protein
MEAGEAGFYLFTACAVATLLWHTGSPVQRHLPSDAVRRMLMGLAMGATIHRDRHFAVGQAVRRAFQSRSHIHVLSASESDAVGHVVLLRRAIVRRGRRRGPRLVCAARRAGAQSGPLRGHRSRRLRRHGRVCRRTRHFFYLDERDPVRDQSRGPRSHIRITLPPSWPRHTSLSSLPCQV